MCNIYQASTVFWQFKAQLHLNNNFPMLCKVVQTIGRFILCANLTSTTTFEMLQPRSAYCKTEDIICRSQWQYSYLTFCTSSAFASTDA